MCSAARACSRPRTALSSSRPGGTWTCRGSRANRCSVSASSCESHRIVWVLAQVTLEALMRLRQEVGGTDKVAQAHVDGGLVIEQAGRRQNRAGLHESVTALLQLHQRTLQRVLISYVIADASGDCRELFHDLRWDVVRESRLGRLK